MVLSKHKFYTRWAEARQRCCNPNNVDYPSYGGRGIEVKFLSSLEMVTYLENLKGYFEGATIDRINNNGHYEEGNLRWASRKEQYHNRRELKPYGKVKEKGIALKRGRYQVYKSGKYLGVFSNLIDAVKRYKL